jgi:ABC-type lipoprotein export system ATPase subunit
MEPTQGTGRRVVVQSRIEATPRVEQVRGMFDIPQEATSKVEWTVALPLTERPWHVGLIVGPSGCGKSTIARTLWPTQMESSASHWWSSDKSLLDGFPESMSVKDVTELLCSVGFSSPPAWLRPFHVLSTGQQFRVTLARMLAEAEGLIVCDEFTSVVDRTVAKIGSAALAKSVRSRKLQFIAVTCHEDVEAWLQPDWCYRPAEGLFLWRSLRRRPEIVLTTFRCSPSAWQLFKPHHYLSDSLNASSRCFLCCWEGVPVAFSAWLPFVGSGPPTRREHRTVVLPDYQGVGIGNALSAQVASCWTALGVRAISTTTHPAMIRSRNRSPLWRMHRAPSLAARGDVIKHASTRLTAGFEYVGPPMHKKAAKLLMDG